MTRAVLDVVRPRSGSMIAACLATTGLAGACAAPPSGPNAPGPSTAPRATENPTRSARAQPPDFELDTLRGDTVRLSDHLGKNVVLLDFWATYCAPCLTAMPHLEQVYQRHKDDGFVILGISIDGSDSVAQVRTEVQKLGVTFPILLDQESRVMARYNPKTSAPFSVLIARSGEILEKKEGYTAGDGSSLDADVAQALAR